jgi:hypothetical protein
MPTKKRKAAAARPATPITAVETKPAEAVRFSAFARKIIEGVKDRLEGEFESFLGHSNVEEQRLMLNILGDYDNRCMGENPRSPGEYEIFLYSAIERQVSGDVCVVLPHDDMVPQVEEFIAALEKKRKPKNWLERTKPETQDGTETRLSRQFRNEMEFFARDAGKQSMSLMFDILARWNSLANDPQMKKFDNTLAAAAEMELDKLRAKAAAEKAVAA